MTKNKSRTTHIKDEDIVAVEFENRYAGVGGESDAAIVYTRGGHVFKFTNEEEIAIIKGTIEKDKWFEE